MVRYWFWRIIVLGNANYGDRDMNLRCIRVGCRSPGNILGMRKTFIVQGVLHTGLIIGGSRYFAEHIACERLDMHISCFGHYKYIA